MNLQTELIAAQQKLAGLMIEGKKVDDAARTTDNALAKLQDASDEVLLAPKYPRDLSEAEKVAAHAATMRVAIHRVIARARIAVAGIEAEITANRRAVVSALISPKIKEFERLSGAVAGLAMEIMTDIAGEVFTIGDIFSGKDSTDKMLIGAMFDAAVRRQRYAGNFSGAQV
jgi:hypothetical protein